MRKSAFVRRFHFHFSAFLLFLALLLAACSKKETPAKPLTATPVSTLTPAVAPASPPTQEIPRFTAEIVAHQEFQKIFAPKLMFRLEPYAGTDSGWTIRTAPLLEFGGPAIDCIGAVETPLHGDTKLEIEPPENGASKDPAWRHREFEYVATDADCKAAWDLMNDANYGSKLSEAEREQASAKLGQIPTGHGKFTILDARLGPATSSNPRGTLERLKFEVELSGGSAPSASSATRKTVSSGANSAIRSIDLKPFIESHLGELNPDLADLATACGEGQKPLQSLAPILYADLDGDGQEEAALEGFSCLSGNGGADFSGVLKLMPDGKLAVLPIEPMPKTFKGRDAYADLRGHMVIEIRDGRLHQVYAIYTGAEANCCPEGGERRFIYWWDGHRFTLDDMIDSPPANSGS
jgi:hypothetical protein